MNKVFNIISALLILTVTAVGNQGGYYVCNARDAFHLTQSCCFEVHEEEECCCCETEDEKNISEVCCTRVDLVVDKYILSKSEGNHTQEPDLVFNDNGIATNWVKYSFAVTGIPPPDPPTVTPLKIYITVCSFLC